MCQARPGLRCTSHAKVSLNNAREDFQSALTEWDSVKNARASDKKSEKLDALEAAQARVHQAEKDYYSSSGGLKELKDMLRDSSLSDVDRAQIQAQIDLAEYDRATLGLAHTLHQGYKNRVSSAMRTQYEILKSQEQQQTARLAMTLNTKGADPREEKAQMRYVKAKRSSHEESMRLKAIEVDRDSTEHGYIRDIVSKRNERDIYLPLNGEDFGRARQYFPYGAYGKITDFKRDESGALQVNIEGKMWKTLNGYTRVMHTSRANS